MVKKTTPATLTFDKEMFKKNVMYNVKTLYRKTLEEATPQQIFQAVAYTVKDTIIDNWLETQQEYEKKDPKTVYYLSMEFLMGRALGNDLINLQEYKPVKEALEELGLDLNVIEDQEPDAALGNGGLGRLAACFLDSIATLGLAGDGVGLNYHLGLFKQEFKDHLQFETPNPWIEPESWLTDAGVSYYVPFKGFMLKSTLYDIDVAGYENKAIKLRLFDIDIADESIVGEGISFDKKDLLHNLTLFLYPDDSDDAGRKLRIYQQYFMVSNAAQLILDEATAKGSNLHDLADYAVIQLSLIHI